MDCDTNRDTRSKKRPITDVLDYPRRRATIAVYVYSAITLSEQI